MQEALSIYRQEFRSSEGLQTPYAMIGVPVVAADTDEQAQRLATTPYQRFLHLIRGEPVYTEPPVESMDRLWSAEERAVVESKLGAAIIGSPETVKRKLAALAQASQVDEFIFTSDLYHHPDRLRSYEIVAEVMNAKTPSAETYVPIHETSPSFGK